MMTSPAFPDWRDLTGNQAPLYLLADDGDQTEADQCLEFAARIKRPQMPWQQDNDCGIMALDGEGLFLHALAADVATRQSGKTLTAAEIRILYGLFVRGERIILSAQRWSTAENTFKRIRRLIASRPSLDRRVTRWICSQGQASVLSYPTVRVALSSLVAWTPAAESTAWTCLSTMRLTTFARLTRPRSARLS